MHAHTCRTRGTREARMQETKIRTPEINRCLRSLRELVCCLFSAFVDNISSKARRAEAELKEERRNVDKAEWTYCRTMWSHGRWRCSTARFDLRLRMSLQQRSPRRRRRRSQRQRSRNPCLRRRRRRPIPCCRLSRRLCPPNRHPVTLSRIRSSIYSWPPIGGTNRRRRFFAEGKFAEAIFPESLSSSNEMDTYR